MGMMLKNLVHPYKVLSYFVIQFNASSLMYVCSMVCTNKYWVTKHCRMMITCIYIIEFNASSLKCMLVVWSALNIGLLNTVAL